jgi:hypothetical protein
VGTGGIIGQHPAEFAHIPAGGVGTEEEIPPAQLLIQFRQHDSRLHPCPTLFLVHVEDTIHSGHIQNDAGADGRAREVGAGGAGGERDAAGDGEPDHGIDVLFGFHEDHGLRCHSIDTGIHRIGCQRGEIVLNLRLPKELLEVADDGV